MMLGYSVLKEYALRSGVRKKDIADLLGISPKTLWNKLRGESDFTFGEAVQIKSRYFPEVPIEQLFEREAQNA